ncbi:MAG: putative cell surface receptor [Parcubacteria group bacterium Gr01-1014_46]|nr:MAG: putative cell surface receptor [Parcubacteria group bacterium Gr01-1014_46]
MKNKKGFTLLISIIVTSMLLIISFVVANVAFKQLVIANHNQESQHAFYNSDSGIECAVYWDFKNGTSAFFPVSNINCGGQPITPTPLVGATTTFRIDFSTSGKGCVDVAVGKYAGGLTIIDSKGYNTCSLGALRRLERGETLIYHNDSNSTGAFSVDTGGTLINNLVSYWKLDESGGSRVDSYSGNTLINNNGVTGVSGKVNNSSNFISASSQYLSIPDNSSLSVGGTSFTIATWVNVSGPNGLQQTIASKRDTGLIREWILSYNPAGNFFFRIFDSAGNTINSATEGTVYSNGWHFVVAWLDTSLSEMNIQVDNGFVTTVPVTSFPVDTTASFAIGAMSIPTEPTGPNSFWNGDIDEFGFWKRILTAQERTDLYNSGTGNTYNP